MDALFTSTVADSLTFGTTLVIILSALILGLGISLAGAFSLIRFRSAPGDSKDIAYVFFTLGVGLACGMGYIGYAVLFAIILCGAMLILTKLNYGTRRRSPLNLKIVLPEDLNYNGVFDKVFKEYITSNKLIKIKTTEFGSLFELTYDIMLKDMADSKDFIDQLRCKNGNLKIMLVMKANSEPVAF